MRSAARILLLLLPGIVSQVGAQPSIEEKTRGMERQDGFFTLYREAGAGRLWLQIDRLGEEFLYQESLATGLGSSIIGLDRTRPGRARIVRFDRIGPKILLVQPSQRFRAITDNPAEKAAVTESFAQSVLWSGWVAAESDPGVLVDATDFIIRDAHDVIGRLRESGQGDFQLDEKRSVVFPPRTRAFPDNVELEALLTFSTTAPGPLVAEVTPTPEAPSIRQRHSLIRLPDGHYTPRAFDPRVGGLSILFSDFATPLEQPLQRRLVSRHRLRKRARFARSSEAVEPIVYYLDPGVPEPVRSALLEGARWWNQAFESAGFRNAFRVEILPQGADPLDIRYNVIQWVHRSSRGWSYGHSVIDPRSGEILKAHVQLGSLRARHDRRLIEGLQPLFPAAYGSGICNFAAGPAALYLAAFDPDVSATEIALARIRQLSAHEVGHTLGLAHNFAASHFGRESVMDYPAPLVGINDDQSLNLSDAYAVGVGEWDKVAIRYAYSDFPPETDEAAALKNILEDAFERGLYFLTDADALGSGAAHAYASPWDNGPDPVAALEQSMKVRRIALDGFSRENLPSGASLGELTDLLVPAYLHHRYQLQAAARLLGGYTYTYRLRGDPLPGQRMTEPQAQKRALAVLVKALGVDEVTLPRRLLDLLVPAPFGYQDRREQFPRTTGRIFDPLSATTVLADLIVSVLLEAQRASRLALAGALDPNQPGLEGVIESLLAATWKAPTSRDGWAAATTRAVERVVLDRLIELAESPRTSSDARSIAASKLRDLAVHLDGRSIQVGVELAHAEEALRRITSFLQRPHHEFTSPGPPAAPPGEPIGNP